MVRSETAVSVFGSVYLLMAVLPAAADEWLFDDYDSIKEFVAEIPAEFRSTTLEWQLIALSESYSSLSGLTRDASGMWLLLKDGTRHLYDDRKKKSAEERIIKADVEDMFFWIYPLEPVDRVKLRVDPGRARAESLFKALYGTNAAEVEANLVTVSFAGRKIRFNKLNGASEALKKAGEELAEAVLKKPELKGYLENLGGTFNWRVISGTDRLSAHSFGIAIDLNVKKSKYWKWESKDSLEKFSRKGFPREIVEVFERNGFIWGGKWYHFDTMHFEYRPEIISAAQLQSGRAEKNE